MPTIIGVDVHDVRFPTAAAGDGSDAINRGDYSATYVELRTDRGPTGAGLTFTNGRGNEVTCAAVRALSPHVLGRRVSDTFAEPVEFWRTITADPQLRWLGPEKGAIHMAGDPVSVIAGRDRLPRAPGYSVAVKPASVAEFSFPDGPAWR